MEDVKLSNLTFAYFPNGLVQPPTRFGQACILRHARAIVFECSVQREDSMPYCDLFVVNMGVWISWAQGSS